jgi:hypothetical protein
MADRGKLPIIEIGYQTYIADGDDPFGAVREVVPRGKPELVIYVENAGDFVVPLSAVEAVHAGKVVLAADRLDARLIDAISRAHDRERL